MAGSLAWPTCRHRGRRAVARDAARRCGSEAEALSPGTRRTDASEKLWRPFRVPGIHHRRAGNEVEPALQQDGGLVLDPPGIEPAIPSRFEEP
ncbi:hypothetical protein [Methylobacterium sp. MA0201]|uniref:hypothetical protein n=1 Tax=Methylobacterium alsaeris TaxID=3344826 RepID=UPI0037572977